MNLRQLSPEKKIAFLKLFTLELIRSVSKSKKPEQEIKIQKLRQRFVEPAIPTEEAFKRVIKSPVFQPSKYEIKSDEKFVKRRVMKDRVRTKPYLFPQKIPRSFIKKIKKHLRKEFSKEAKQFKPPSSEQILTQTQPQFQLKPKFNLGKIEIFLQDPFLQSIECPGPGKNILIKKQNKITPTRMTLSQEEINNIINNFSNEAKIPIVGGILKAAVGNLIISAVMSEFVGSRFIINKIPSSQIPLI